MPILALADSGLIVNAFDKDYVVRKSTDYVTSNNILLNYDNKQLVFIDLLKNEPIKSHVFSRIKEMKISSNGKNAVALTNSNKLIIFKDFNLVQEVDTLEDCYGVTDEFFYYSEGDRMILKNFEGSFLYETAFPKCTVTIGKYLFFITKSRKEELSDLFVYSINSKTSFFKVKEALSMKAQKKNNNVILLVKNSYSKKTYFANWTILFIKLESSKIELDEANPPVFSNNGIYVWDFTNYKLFLDIGFTKDSFFICYGKQPSLLREFSCENASVIKEHRKLLRNIVKISPSKKEF